MIDKTGAFFLGTFVGGFILLVTLALTGGLKAEANPVQVNKDEIEVGDLVWHNYLNKPGIVTGILFSKSQLSVMEVEFKNNKLVASKGDGSEILEYWTTNLVQELKEHLYIADYLEHQRRGLVK